MIINAAGWLEENQSGHPPIALVPSVRLTPLEVPAPLGLVWHWTGGRCTTAGHAPSLAQWIATLDRQKEPNPQSWHVLIAKDGRVFQSVPFSAGSWHVGKPGKVGAHQSSNINRCTVGVELENAGRLLAHDGKAYCSPWWSNPEAPPARRMLDPRLEVPAARLRAEKDPSPLNEGQWFDEFPEAQVAAAERVLRALVWRFKWTREVVNLGHLTFDSPRKEDPGPLWMNEHLPKLLDAVFA